MYPDAPVTHTTFPAPVIVAAAAAELIAAALRCCVAPGPPLLRWCGHWSCEAAGRAVRETRNAGLVGDFKSIRILGKNRSLSIMRYVTIGLVLRAIIG